MRAASKSMSSFTVIALDFQLLSCCVAIGETVLLMPYPVHIRRSALAAFCNSASSKSLTAKMKLCKPNQQLPTNQNTQLTAITLPLSGLGTGYGQPDHTLGLGRGQSTTPNPSHSVSSQGFVHNSLSHNRQLSTADLKFRVLCRVWSPAAQPRVHVWGQVFELYKGARRHPGTANGSATGLESDSIIHPTQAY